MRKTILPFLMMAAVLFATGCGDKRPKLNATVEGTVTIEGELLTSGTVMFYPVGDGPIAYGKINTDGSYSLRTGQGNLKDPDGGAISSGGFIATVVATGPSSGESYKGEGGPPVIGKRLTADKYASKDTSDLLVSVKQGRNVIVLKLEAIEEVEILEDAEEDAETDEGQIDSKSVLESEDTTPDEDQAVESSMETDQ